MQATLSPEHEQGANHPAGRLAVKHSSLPPPTHYTRPTFVVPAGACCTHSHVIPEDCTLVADHSYVPAPATEAQYLAMLDALSLDHGVLVQVSVLGTDNSAMLAALERNPQRLRGVAVVEPDVSDAELQLGQRNVEKSARMLSDAQRNYEAYQKEHGELVVLSDVKRDLLRVHTSMGQSLVSIFVGLGINRERAISSVDTWFKHLRESRFASGTMPELRPPAASAA